jgi:hypothetical protein
MTEIRRVEPGEARQKMQSGALLVCAYDSNDKFRENHLDGAMSLEQFEAQADSFPKEREIIFYCA